jgi:hypothetical protein
MAATNVIVIMANASSTSFAMTAVAVATSTTTRRVPPSTRTRPSSPVAYMARKPITCATSAVLTHATKGTPYHVQTTTTTSAGIIAITKTITAPVAMTSCAGVTILSCPATETLEQAARAKPRRFFHLSEGKNNKKEGRLMCLFSLTLV